MPPLRVATRGSALARWQAERVVQFLGVEAEYVIVSTRGDERRDVPIHTMGGTGVFVKEVEQAVLDGRADVAVHSAKDLPSETSPELVLAALPERGDPRDALVGRPLDGTRELLAGIDDAAVRAAVTAERSYLAELGGGCNLPCGALAETGDDGSLRLEALLGSLDGRISLRARVEGHDPLAVGVEAARRLVDEEGGRLVLDDELVERK